METQTEHLPVLLRRITIVLDVHLEQISDSELVLCLRLCSKILSRVQPSAVLAATDDARVGNAGSPLKRQKLLPTSVIDNFEREEHARNESVEKNGDPELDKTQRRPDALAANHIGGDGVENNPDSCREDGVSSRFDVNDSLSFGDFVQFEGKTSCDMPATASESAVTQEVGDETAPKGGNSLTLLQACIQNFLHLFETIVATRVLPDANLPVVFMNYLVMPRLEDGDSAFGSAFSCSSFRSETLAAPSQKDLANTRNSFGMVKVSLDQLSKIMCEAFTCACQLLVEFSALPIYCTSSHQEFHGSIKPG